MRTLFLTFLLAAFSLSAGAEGVWKRYPSFNLTRDVVCEGDYVWCGTTAGVIKRNRHDGSYIRYTTADGLAGNSVRTILVDRNGRKWFATDGGLSRLDGNTWTTYPPEEEFARHGVQSMAEDRDGVLWFGTGSGVFSFDGSAWKRYTSADGLGSDNISDVAVDSNNVKWFAGGEILTSFDGETWKVYTKDDGVPGHIFSLAADRNGMIWMANGGILTSFDGVRFMRYRSNSYFSILSIFIDDHDVKWLGATDGLYLFENYEWKRLSSLFNSYLAEYCPDIEMDDDGHIWTCLGDSYSFSYGVARFDGANWTQYTVNDGPPCDKVEMVGVDTENRKWFGTFFQGVACFDGATWSVPLSLTESSYEYNSIACDLDGVLWLTTYDGILMSGNGETWKRWTPDEGTPRWVGCATVGPDNVKWFSTNGGVARFDGKTWRTYTAADGLLNTVISTIAVDRDNVVWAGSPEQGGTGGGLASFDGKTWKNYTYWDGMRYGDINAIAVDADNVKWFATPRGAMSFDGKTWKTYYTRDGLAGDTVKTVAVDRNNAKWFVTSQGISRFDGKTWKNYLPDVNLPLGGIDRMAVDRNNVKWFVGYQVGIISFDEGIPVAVQEATEQPVSLSLSNHPNPFNPSTTITFSLPEPERAVLTVYNRTGQKVRTLVSGYLPAGKHAVVWDGRDDSGKSVSSGPYLTRITVGKSTAVGKMTLLR